MSSVDSASNVDPGEIAKFEALASRWWDPEGEFKPLHQINPLRLDYVDSRAKLAGKTVLDVGCGGGILAESMAARGARVMGIDLGEAPLAVARLHRHESGVEVDYRAVSVEDLAVEMAGQFDIITCMEMLEHVPDPSSVVAACATLLKPGGAAFFSTINRTAKGFAFAIVGAEYLLRLLPRGTHEYAKFIRPSELDDWARAAGFSLADSTGMHYHPIFKDYRLGPGLDVNYLMHFERAA
ncbi:MAG TPA: bifunctional 2-polyprenyl-6-hydroxyphenol methylase/3-demethylubiquinol 3-O-methyltransferase UbiG [Gammaproteobacteria bacterium]|nr:bifunctional 2-polyprenyl-6-hydroxyphenol methylase/3-demethylubiquinol 3-O-methyltransferase UbiG [Gammaproteobacteria bacterium]